MHNSLPSASFLEYPTSGPNSSALAPPLSILYNEAQKARDGFAGLVCEAEADGDDNDVDVDDVSFGGG